MALGIARIWTNIESENPGIGDRLDQLFSTVPNETGCHQYKRQRKRLPQLTHRGRLCYKYDGVWHQMAAYRMQYIRHYGSIPEGYDVAHVCQNGHCGNVDHLFALPRSSHCKFDNFQREWIAEIKKIFPDVKPAYGALSVEYLGISDSVETRISEQPANEDIQRLVSEKM